MAKDAGKKSFLDFFKVKNIDDDEDEFDDDLFDDDDYDDDDDDDYEDVKPRARSSFCRRHMSEAFRQVPVSAVPARFPSDPSRCHL